MLFEGEGPIPGPSFEEDAGLVEDETEGMGLLESDINTVSCGERVPILITDTICDNNVWQLNHDRLGSRVHEIECSAVIWLLEVVFA